MNRRQIYWLLPITLFLLWVIDRSIATIQIDWWWFQALGYAQNFQRQFQTQSLLAILGGGIASLWLGSSYRWSQRWQLPPPMQGANRPLVAEPLEILAAPNSNLLLLMTSLVGSSLLASSAMLYPLRTLVSQTPLLALAGGLTIAMASWPQQILTFLLIAVSGWWGYFWATNWTQILPAFGAVPFGQREPLFNRDLSFYIFQLPVRELIDEYTLSLTLLSLAVAVILYLRPQISDGWMVKMPPQQLRHLAFLAGALAWAIAHHFALTRYQLLYSQRGVVYGAGYADIWGYLPISNILLTVNCILALGCWGWAAGIWRRLTVSSWFIKLMLMGVTLLALLPTALQWGLVLPNELAIEQPYLQHNIAFTRQAFDLDKIDIQTFDPSGDLTAQDLAKNSATIANIRLWDTRPLLQSNRQLQQIRPYYKFANADIDRYTIGNAPQQVFLSAREIDSQSLTDKALTWINQHLVYTHGYGYTVSPVNRAAMGGLPDYLVKDIRGKETASNPDPAVLATEPRIYYGEITDNYIFAPSVVRELDYPSGSENVYNSYSGSGGIKMQGWWPRWIAARYLQDAEVLFTKNFTAQSQLLLHRSITTRVQKLAPWLTLDKDPYLVIAKSSQTHQNRLYWLLDAYTTSSHYPYADPGKGQLNYIRNSVKVSIDAYDGSTQFYISNEHDPILQTWQRVMPQMWQPLSAMPPSLRQHLRYPTDLFRIQSDRLRTYHMQDPQVFYNREDLWQIPQEIYGTKSQAVEPYYLITKLPNGQAEEFLLLSPFTPNQRTNLIAWLAARSDGEQYGKLSLYLFPKQQLVYGTEQIESLIDQDPVISQQISLWNRQGTSAVKGNLLVIPIERSLLYVEPLYLESRQNSLPTLGRVIVVYRDRIKMAETLTQALQKIFPDQKSLP
jgi:uncharacterized protein